MSKSGMEQFFKNLAIRRIPYWGHNYIWTGVVDADYIDNLGKCTYCGDERWMHNLLEFERGNHEQCPARLNHSWRNTLRLWFRNEPLETTQDLLEGH